MNTNTVKFRKQIFPKKYFFYKKKSNVKIYI